MKKEAFQIYLTERQKTFLKKRADRYSTSVSDILRRLLDKMIDESDRDMGHNKQLINEILKED